jgi:adenine-specific DNA-methyltransferase
MVGTGLLKSVDWANAVIADRPITRTMIVMSSNRLLTSDRPPHTASDQLDPNRRASLGQFMTPAAIADFMASLFQRWPDSVRLLDPGGGMGSLSIAFARQYVKKKPPGSSLSITTYEIEPALAGYLAEHLNALEQLGHTNGFHVSQELLKTDFIREAAFAASFAARRYTHVILNPPYKKIGASSEYRKLLRSIGVETGNLYSAFLALAVAMTEEQGEIVAIIPRSFCNGLYFRPFRNWLLSRVALTHVHVFESRKRTFDDVLQENIIVRLQRDGPQGSVVISSSHDPTFNDYQQRQIPFAEIVKPNDPEQFIHIPTFETNGSSTLFKHTLLDLGLAVATGPVVDFRLRHHSRPMPKPGMVPLLYAHHFSGGTLQWPREHKKPNRRDRCHVIEQAGRRRQRSHRLAEHHPVERRRSVLKQHLPDHVFGIAVLEKLTAEGDNAGQLAHPQDQAIADAHRNRQRVTLGDKRHLRRGRDRGDVNLRPTTEADLEAGIDQ